MTKGFPIFLTIENNTVYIYRKFWMVYRADIFNSNIMKFLWSAYWNFNLKNYRWD